MKEAEVENQEIDPKYKDALCSQPSQKEDPPAKRSHQDFVFFVFVATSIEYCFVASLFSFFF